MSGGSYFFTSPRTAHLLINLRANRWDSLKSAFRTSFTRRGREFASTVVQVFLYACGRQHRLGRFIRRRVPTRFPEPRVRSSRRAARTAEWHLGDFCCSTVSQRTCSIECIAYVPWSMFAVAFPKADSPEGRLRVGYGRSPRPIQCPLFNPGAVVSQLLKRMVSLKGTGPP